MPALRILMVAAEMAPFAQEGGLGDSVLGLSRALAGSAMTSGGLPATPPSREPARLRHAFS